MNDDNKAISDYLNNLKKESGIKESSIDEPDTNTAETEPSKNICKLDEPSTEISVPVKNQSYQSEPTTCESSVFDNNISVEQEILNLLSSGLIRCFNKYIQIPNYFGYAYICFDSSYNAYLCTKDINGQFLPFANVLLEGSEFSVYQNYQKIGALYGNDNEQVWQFIPNNMLMPNQNPQYIHPSTPNTPTYNYVFNNVPQEQASEIIASIIKNKPSNNVEINFASPTEKPSPATEDYIDAIDISTENYSTN